MTIYLSIARSRRMPKSRRRAENAKMSIIMFLQRKDDTDKIRGLDYAYLFIAVFPSAGCKLIWLNARLEPGQEMTAGLKD